MGFFRKEGFPILLLTLFSASIFVIGLGKMPLTDPDESFYAETAKEMLGHKDFLTPYIFDKPQFEKPPLYYWLIISSFKVFGTNEFSARLPSAIFGVLGVIAVYFLGKLFVNAKTGFISAVILATNIEYIFLSRACVTDIVLAVFILLTILYFFYGYNATRKKSKWYLASSVCMGLAVLTKGPIGAFLPIAIIGIYLILTKEIKRLKEIPLVSGGVLFLAVCLPWYAMMYKTYGREFIDAFFGFQNIIRFLEPEHTLGDVFYYYVPVLIVGFFPWTIFLPLGIWQGFREKNHSVRRNNVLLAVWFLVVFIFFSISRTKLPTYIFPLFPALALSAGRFSELLLSGDVTPKMKKTFSLLLCLYLVLIVIGAAGLYFVIKVKYPSIMGKFFTFGIPLVLFMIFSMALLLAGKHKAGFNVFAGTLLIFIFPISSFVFSDIGRYESSKEISGVLRALVKPEDKIGAETDYQRGIAFYTGRTDIVDVHPHDTIIKFLPRTDRVWCVIKEKNHIQLYTNEKKAYEEPTYVVYRLGKKVLITNKIPEDGRFLKKRTKDEPY
ncbi:MAG: glycosyltransferase family 39 protein [Candidatus Omnitrophica bacterium]|nr:glycosyltransferase family 39 protein [Candidatus Omnitrophota bacterium]